MAIRISLGTWTMYNVKMTQQHQNYRVIFQILREADKAVCIVREEIDRVRFCCYSAVPHLVQGRRIATPVCALVRNPYEKNSPR